MRVNRTLLYAGVFLFAVGAVVVVADLVDADTSILVEALRFWPLALIALGAGIVLRRSPAALPAGLLAAAVPGLVLGGTFAAAPRFGNECAGSGEVPTVVTDAGSFAGPARVSVVSACGSVNVTTADGVDWSLHAAAGEDRQPPVVDASSTALRIRANHEIDWRWFGDEISRLDLSVPTSRLNELTLDLSLGEASIDLDGADIGRLDVQANLGKVAIDATGASVTELSGELNLGSLTVQLPAESDLDGSLTVNGGEVVLCAPESLGLRVIRTGSAGEIRGEGGSSTASRWTSSNYESATHRADLVAEVNFGGIRINPIGACS